MKKLFIVFASITALAMLLNVPYVSAQGKLEGVWKITEITLTGPNAQKITNPQPSIVVFTKKYYSMVVIQGPRPDLPQKGATDSEKVATWTPFSAEAGTYEIKGNTITSKVIVAKSPGAMAPGNFFTADFKILGNTFTMTPKNNSMGPIANPYTVTFMRLE
jgi:hypothetical protein